MIYNLETFILDIDNANSIERLWDISSTFLKSTACRRAIYEYRFFGIKEINKGTSVFKFSSSENATEDSINGQLHLPIHFWNIISKKPETYTWVGRHDVTQTDSTEKEIGFFKRRVLLIPVYGPGGSSGCFGIEFESNFDRTSETTVRDCQTAFTYMHQKMSSLKIQNERQFYQLSKRETQIIKLVSLGNSNIQIAEITGLSRHTIDSYLRRIFTKLDVTDRTSAAFVATRLNIY